MTKIFHGQNYAAAMKEADDWVKSQGASIKNTLITSTMVRRERPKTGTPKDEGEWTVSVEYEI